MNELIWNPFERETAAKDECFFMEILTRAGNGNNETHQGQQVGQHMLKYYLILFEFDFEKNKSEKKSKFIFPFLEHEN